MESMLRKMALVEILLVVVFLGLIVPTPVYADTCRIQMPASGYDPLGGDNVTLPGTNPWTRLGQRVSMTDRTVLSIGYHVRRIGMPTGNVTLSIRDAVTDEVLFSAVWGDASQLPESGQSGYCEVELDSPMLINQDVRICVEYYGGNSTDYCQGAYYTGDKITGESYTNYNSQWHDIGEAEEGSYCYSYVCQAEPPPDDNDIQDGGMIRPILISALAVCAIGIGYLMRNKRRA